MPAKVTADVDCDQRRYVCDCVAVAGNELVSAQFAVHPFDAATNCRSLLLAVFRELFEAASKDWTSVLGGARCGCEQFQFHAAIPPLDLGLFAKVAPEAGLVQGGSPSGYRQIATDSERCEPSSSCRTGTAPEELIARNSRRAALPGRKYQSPQVQVRCLSLPRRCGPGEDSVPASGL